MAPLYTDIQKVAFLPALLASTCISCRHASVCSSVTSRCSTETAKCRITQTMPHNSSGTFFWRRRSPQNSNGVSQWRPQIQVG